MLALARYLTRLAVAFWLGEMLFFITVYAPRVFRVLPREQAGILQGAIFPGYYKAGLIAAAVFAGGLFVRTRLADPQLAPGWRGTTGAWTLALIAALIFAWSLYVITPELNGLRPELYADPENPLLKANFDKLHRFSVMLNSGALFALLALLALI